MKIGPAKTWFRRLGLFVIIGLVLALMMSFNTFLENLNRLQNALATQRVQATNVMVIQEGLQTQVVLATSPAAVNDYARDGARMGQPGDKVIIVLPDYASTPQAPVTPIPVSIPHAPLDVWMFLIFGK
jgi:hypothetical protein